MNVLLCNRDSLRVSVVADSLAGIARFYAELRYLGTISACIIGTAAALTMHRAKSFSSVDLPMNRKFQLRVIDRNWLTSGLSIDVKHRRLSMHLFGKARGK